MAEWYEFRSRRGTFRIVRQGHRWQAMCDDEALGSYANPHQALDDLVGGSTYWPSSGDPSKAGLSDDLGDWQHVRR